ncbi:MAG: type II toxin-antitoxin system RelE/ParE family toxin [Bosea sp. (in: a-proteobacteria)]
MAHVVRLTEAAENDLIEIFTFVANHSSGTAASRYLNRILKFMDGFVDFPERGTLRSDVRPGLRTIGFERRVTLAFTVDGNDVVFLRILYAGRQFDLE